MRPLKIRLYFNVKYDCISMYIFVVVLVVANNKPKVFYFVFQWFLRHTACSHLSLKDSCSQYTEIISATDQANARPGNSNPNPQRTCELATLWIRSLDGFYSMDSNTKKNTLRFSPVKCRILPKTTVSSYVIISNENLCWVVSEQQGMQRTNNNDV